MSFIYRGICKIDDLNNAGLLKPKGKKIEVPIKWDGGFKWDSGVTWDESEANTVIAHQMESGKYDGCFVSFTRDESIAVNFSTSGNLEEGYVYVVDESLLAQYEVASREVAKPEHPHESEVSLRAKDGGILPSSIVVKKYEVKPT